MPTITHRLALQGYQEAWGHKEFKEHSLKAHRLTRSQPQGSSKFARSKEADKFIGSLTGSRRAKNESCERCPHHEAQLQEQTLQLAQRQEEIARLNQCYDQRQEVSCESKHPYPPQCSMVWALRIPGAIRVSVRFHPASSLADGDRVVLYKSKLREEDDVWGSFGASSDWPGTGNKEPLEITSGVVYVGFFSASGQGQTPWGFKLFASATHFRGEALQPSPTKFKKKKTWNNMITAAKASKHLHAEFSAKETLMCQENERLAMELAAVTRQKEVIEKERETWVQRMPTITHRLALQGYQEAWGHKEFKEHSLKAHRLTRSQPQGSSKFARSKEADKFIGSLTGSRRAKNESCERCPHHEAQLQEQTLQLAQRQEEIARLNQCYDQRQEVSCESKHPYPPQCSMVWALRIPGAIRVSVRFHPASSLADGDRVVLYKSKLREEDDVWGSFGASSDWPGTGNKEPLEITSGVVYVGFFSASGQGQTPWGFKLFASATHFRGEALQPSPTKFKKKKTWNNMITAAKASKHLHAEFSAKETLMCQENERLAMELAAVTRQKEVTEKERETWVQRVNRLKEGGERERQTLEETVRELQEEVMQLKEGGKIELFEQIAHKQANQRASAQVKLHKELNKQEVEENIARVNARSNVQARRRNSLVAFQRVGNKVVTGVKVTGVARAGRVALKQQTLEQKKKYMDHR